MGRKLTTFFREGVIGARLISRIPSYLKQPIPAADARKAVRNSLARREEGFLDHLRRFVYSRPDSPYLRLLRLAGCEFGDFQHLVLTNGLDGTLQALGDQGVCLTSKEFHGRCDVVRGSLRFRVEPRTLVNPVSRSHVPLRSSGSRSSGTPVMMDLASKLEVAKKEIARWD